MRPRIEDALSQAGDTPAIRATYFEVLLLDMARGQQPDIDASAAVLRRLLRGSHNAALQSLVTAIVEDDPALLDAPGIAALRELGWCHISCMLMNEHGASVPIELMGVLEQLQSSPQLVDSLPPTIEIAKAIAAGDPAALSCAIDDAERHQLIPHAARMRIVLAEMTGDPAPLERARPVLERLQDRQFLRRLEDVASRISARKAG
jgi:hypothetical protein